MENHNYQEELEIDLREYILLLWNKKWIILALIGLAALAALLYSHLMLDVKYNLSSEILVYPPAYTEIEVADISLATYRRLARSDRVLNNIIAELDLRNDENERLSPSDIRGNLEINIIDENGFDDGSALLFELLVTGTDPDKSADIANSWSNLFMEDILDIRQSETEDIFRVTSQRFEETRNRLEEVQENLQNVREEYRTDYFKASKASYDDRIKTTEEKLLQLKETLGVKEAEKQQIRANLAQIVNQEGVWLGNLSRARYVNLEGKFFLPLRNLLDLQNSLLDFWEENNLQQLEQELKHVTEKLKSYHLQLAELEASYFAARADFEEIEVLLQEEPEKFELSRGLSEDALWDNILSPNNLEILADLTIVEEQMNPVFEVLRQQRAEAFISINSLPGQIENLEEEVAELQQRERALRTNLQELELEESNYKTDIILYENIYADLQQDYHELVVEDQHLTREIAGLDSEITYYRVYHQELLEEVQDIESQIWQAEREEDRLKREISIYERSYESLSRRVEDARLAQAEQTSDVRFVAEAIPPGETIGRGTTLNMAIAAVLAGMLGIFGVFFKEFLQEGDEFKAD